MNFRMTATVTRFAALLRAVGAGVPDGQVEPLQSRRNLHGLRCARFRHDLAQIDKPELRPSGPCDF